MASKLFYTSVFGKAAGDIAFVNHYEGVGLYFGTRYLATEERLAEFHARLKTDKIEAPQGQVYCAELRKLRGEDITQGLHYDRAKDIVDLLGRFIEPVRPNTRLRVSDNLYYVCGSYAGRLSAAFPMINAWDRAHVRASLLRIIDESCQPIYRVLSINERRVYEKAIEQNN